MPGSSSFRDDESDHESVNELLSPSDGYFAEGHAHPGEVLVPDPSQGRSQLDKEREARDEIRASPSSSSYMPPRINTSTQSVSNVQSPPPASHTVASSSTGITESTPLIRSAPPAYSPPEPGSPYHQHTRNTSNAGIYETMGRPDPFFPSSAADLGGDRDSLLPNGNKEKRWSSRLRNWWEDNSYKVFKYIMLTFAFVIAVLFLIEIIKEIGEEDSRRRHDHEHIDLPAGNGIPSSCNIRGSGQLDFTWEKEREFALVELPKPAENGPRNVRVQNMGVVHVRTLPKNVKEAFKVDMIYYYSSHAVVEEFSFSKIDQVLRIHTASTVQDYSDSSNQPCLYLNITVWVNANLVPEDLYISTTTLDVIFEKDHTALAQNITVATLTGSVTSIANDTGGVSWGGREVTIITDTASIHGAYPLYDKLYLETRTGSINTQLTLHPGRYGRQSEALLVLKTLTGSVHAETPTLRAVEEGRGNFTIDDIPKRDYRTEVSVHSGSTQLQLVHGSLTSVSTDTGSVHIELTPWLEPRKDSNIVVSSKTGGIDVTVRDAIAYKDQPLRHLYGLYTFPTGHLTLRYPAEWEGDVVGKLMTGSMRIDWPGLELRRHERTGIYNVIEASKGKGDGWVHFSGGSGSVDLIGKGGSKYPKIFNQVIKFE